MPETPYVGMCAEWAEKLLKLETRGNGDTENAMRRLSRRYGVPFRALWALRYRRPKDVFASVFFALQNAYRAECERQLERLHHEIEITKKVAGASAPSVRAAEALVGAIGDADRRSHP